MKSLFATLPSPSTSGLPAPGSRLRPLTPAEQIAQHLGRAILKGDCPDGSRILEQEIADQFGVSRGPVRDALRELHKEGLVDINPRRGTFAVGVNLADVIDIYNIRGALLAVAVRYITLQQDAAALAQAESVFNELKRLHAMGSPPLAEFIRAIGRIARSLVRASNSRHLTVTYRNLPHGTLWHMLWVTDEPLDYTQAERRNAVVNDFDSLFRSIHAGLAPEAERLMCKINSDSCREVVGRMARNANSHLDSWRLRTL
jgi:DNA-binding GntR family transcriptional regulator